MIPSALSNLPFMPLDRNIFDPKFDCSEAAQNYWYHHRALKNQSSGYAFTQVLLDTNNANIGFVATSIGQIVRGQMPTAGLRRNAPNHVGLALISQLGVDKNFQGQGYGIELLLRGIKTCAAAAGHIGIPFVGVHPGSVRLESFYAKAGFSIRIANNGPVLMLMPMPDARYIAASI